jgi:hypothetical protein
MFCTRAAKAAIEEGQNFLTVFLTVVVEEEDEEQAGLMRTPQ